MKYITPNVDKVMSEFGWIRLSEHPVYLKKTDENEYSIIYHPGLGEIEVVEGYFSEWTGDQFKTAVGTLIASMNTCITEAPYYDTILMWIADCYYQKGDDKNFERVKQEYKILTGYDYK